MKAHLALAGTALGAWWAPGPPWWASVAAAVVVVTVLRRWPSVLLFGLSIVVVVAASAYATNALDFPAAGAFDQWVTLVDDPVPSGPVGVRVTVRAEGRRLTATAHGAVAGQLDNALAGERLRLRGTIRAVSRNDDRSINRHVVGRISVAAVVDEAAAAPVAAGANQVRRLLSDGADSLSRSDHALFLGMVIGDDREQGAVTADDFRAAGLGHLLVVSGQNVAFVLAVAMPVAGRLRPGGRAVVLFLVLGIFAVLTRFEPSVLRATAMAGVGIGGAALGRPVDGRQGLSWAVAGLLVIDPFLISVVAFQLSAAATAGIVWWSQPIAERLAGPRWWTVPLSTTVSAQLAVSPLLLSLFGPLPLASLPANLLAGPASGAVMIWGCTGGLVAGLLGGRAAAVLHWPTAALLWWVGGVARLSAAGPAATLGAGALAVMAAATLMLVRLKSRVVGGLSAAVIAAVLTWSVVGAPQPLPGPRDLGNGVSTFHRGNATVVVLDDPVSGRRVLETLRLAGIRRPSVLVVLDGDRSDANAAIALHKRFGPLPTAAPPMHRVPGARTVQLGQLIELPDVIVQIDAVEPRIELTFLPVESPR